MLEILRRANDKRLGNYEKWKALLEVEDPSAEQRAEMDRLEAAIDEATRDIERIERGLSLQRNLEAVKEIVPSGNGGGTGRSLTAVDGDEGHEDRYEKVFSKYLRRGMIGLTEEERNLLVAGHVAADELRALGTTPDSAGGYLVPPAFEVRLVEAMKAYGAVQDLAETIVTATGADIEWPTVDDTANVGAILAENTAATEQDVVFGTKTLSVYLYVSKMIRVSLQLINDSAFDLEGFIERASAERIARILNQHFTTGTGTAQPQGIVTGGTAVVHAAAGITVTYDGLVDLMHAIDPAYRNANARWMFNDAFLKLVRKLKTTDGMPIWQPGLQAGEPGTLLGFPYVLNQDMAAPALNAKSALFGDIRSGYIVRRVGGVGQIASDDRYLEFLQRVYMTFLRAGGAVSQAAAYRVWQFAAA